MKRYISAFCTSHFHDVNMYIKKHGIQASLILFFQRSQTTFLIHGLTKDIKNILQKKSVIIIANHPYESDPFILLAALPKRDDMFMIFTHVFYGLHKTFDKHLIPVFIQHQKKSFLNLKMRFLHWLLVFPTYTKMEEDKKNRDSIDLARKKLLSGSGLIICPSGRSKKIQWQSGIGHILYELPSKKRPEIIFVYISGTSNLDIFRFIKNSGQFLPKISLTFTNISYQNDIKKYSPKEITNILEKKYTNWVKNL